MSYRITINGEPFCSSRTEHTSLIDPKVKLEANKAGSFTFIMLPDHPYYDRIELRQSMFDVYQNEELIFEGVATGMSTDFFGRRTIECEGDLTFLNDSIQRQAVYQNQTVQSLLGAYLAIHNQQADTDKQFAIGSVTVDGGSQIYRYTNFQNTMTEIGEDLVDNFGGFLRVRHENGTRYLDYIAASPRTSSQEIRIGKNLVDLSQNLSSLDICTVLIPLGAKLEDESDVQGLDKRLTIESVNSGKDYLVGTAAAYYGNIWRTQIWDDVSTASILKTKGQAYLDEIQWANLVIEASAIDLGLTSEDVEQFRVLDMIRVISEPHGLNRLFMLTRLDIDLDHPGSTQITLGQDQRLSLSARSAKNTAEIKQAETNIIVNASENAKQILESSTDGNIYFRYGSNGKLYEIDIMDTDNPDTAQRIWRWNLGGWGYSGDGGETYTVAATMDGAIVASMITTGILKSDDGTTFYLDLDNGILKGNFSELSISGSAAASQSYADGKASAAQSNAISAAATDATSKANAAKTSAVSEAASNTSTAISNYDASLDQQEVFDRLTNKKANQGIFLENGDLYINASMINAGTLSADYIQGGTLSGMSINIGNGNFTVDAAGNVSASAIDILGNSEINIYNPTTKERLSLDTGGIYVTDDDGDDYMVVDKNMIWYYNDNTGDSYFRLMRNSYGGSLEVWTARGGKATIGATGTQTTPQFKMSNSGGFDLVVLSPDTNGNGLIETYSSQGEIRAQIGDGVAAYGGGFRAFYNGVVVANLGRTTANNGLLNLRDIYNTIRVGLNDGGLYFYDNNGTRRCWLNPTSGLYFYNTSGTVTKSYPAT